MRTITRFDTCAHHIHIDFCVTDSTATTHACEGIVDTGAPRTEFNDSFLIHAGFLPSPQSAIQIKPNLQTEKYTKIVLPSVTICGHTIDDFAIVVSRFDPTWGIGALIGLDFFRRFRVTIDYGHGALTCEPL